MLRGIYPVCLLKVNSREFGRAWLSLIIRRIQLTSPLERYRSAYSRKHLGPLAQKLLGNAAFWDTNALEFKRGGVSEEKLQKIREAMFALSMTPNNLRRETDLPNATDLPAKLFAKILGIQTSKHV
jgi:hypothetical protein